MRNGTCSPLGLTIKPTRGLGVGSVVELEVIVAVHGGNVDEVVAEGEVIVIRIEGGGSAGRAFFGRLVEMITGSSGSRRCEATEGRGRL